MVAEYPPLQIEQHRLEYVVGREHGQLLDRWIINVGLELVELSELLAREVTVRFSLPWCPGQGSGRRTRASPGGKNFNGAWKLLFLKRKKCS